MYPLRIGLAALLFLGVSAAGADDKKDLDKDKLVGTWELTQGETLPPGTTCEFTKDGKIKLVLPTPDGKKVTIEGTYKIEGQAFRATLKDGNKENTETLKVPTLTDKELVMVDEKGKKDSFKKK
jgi:uncharacterized protein (TIGR03066 family)